MKTDAKNLQQRIDAARDQVAARLVEFREAAGVSIQEMVNATGLSRAGIDKMEGRRGERRQSSPTVRSIGLHVAVCGRTLAEFFEAFNEHANGNGNGHGRKKRK